MTGCLAAACAGSGSFGSNGGLVITPSRVEGVIPGAGPVTTTAATAVASFGTGPYTYAWTRTSGDTNFSANSASSASSTFTDSLVGMGDVVIATFTCTATDSLSASRTATCEAIGRSSSTA